MSEIVDDSKFEQVSHRDSQRELAMEEASGFIGSVIAEVNTLGANDSEIGELQSVLDKLHKGILTPEAAKAQAVAIKNSKMDYH